MALAPSIRRVRKLEERGTPANGVITGIHFSLNNETTRKEFTVSVLGASGWQRFGVRTQPTEAHRLRLGVPVVAKVDGDRGILDWDAMAAAWGLEGTSSRRSRCASHQPTASWTPHSTLGCNAT